MSIIIKGMDMPKGCDETCPLKSAGWCCEGNDCPLIEIVQCKECKWSYRDERDGILWCKVHLSHYRVNGDCFCSYGERRKDESNN